MTLLPLLVLLSGLVGAGLMLRAAFGGTAGTKTHRRRVAALKTRHLGGSIVEAQLRRVLQQRDTRLDRYFVRRLPNPAMIERRLDATGRNWTIGCYAMASIGVALAVAIAAALCGLPLLLVLVAGLFAGIMLPTKFIGMLIDRRIRAFTARFPDAIDLLVRGLRSGLPISETLSVVGTEVPGPVGIEFRAVSDRMKIGRTMDSALQETADRLETPEFQFFVITLAIQRETGGNLAETLANLADVLRRRAQLRLKVKAMASESKASAMILGALPFVVFLLIYAVNGEYMAKFFSDQRLTMIGGGGVLWMAIGAYIMAQMIDFEI
jgi:tight adherence protein B